MFFAFAKNWKRILGLTLLATYSYFISAVLLLSGFAPLHPLLLLNLLLQEIEPPLIRNRKYSSNLLRRDCLTDQNDLRVVSKEYKYDILTLVFHRQ
jgi:hypothetical protein